MEITEAPVSPSIYFLCEFYLYWKRNEFIKHWFVYKNVVTVIIIVIVILNILLKMFSFLVVQHRRMLFPNLTTSDMHSFVACPGTVICEGIASRTWKIQKQKRQRDP